MKSGFEQGGAPVRSLSWFITPISLGFMVGISTLTNMSMDGFKEKIRRKPSFLPSNIGFPWVSTMGFSIKSILGKMGNLINKHRV